MKTGFITGMLLALAIIGFITGDSAADNYFIAALIVVALSR